MHGNSGPFIFKGVTHIKDLVKNNHLKVTMVKEWMEIIMIRPVQKELVAVYLKVPAVSLTTRQLVEWYLNLPFTRDTFLLLYKLWIPFPVKMICEGFEDNEPLGA